MVTNVKQTNTLKSFFSPEQRAAALAAAPDVAVADDDNPATGAVDWSRAVVTHGGGIDATLSELREKLAARRRGRNKRPTKEPVTVRYSPDVLAYFRASGAGWQTRMDEALREWVKSHSPA